MDSSPRPYRIGIDARFFRRETSGLGRYTRELLHNLAAIDRHNQYFVFITPADLSQWDIQQDNFHQVVVPALHYSFREQTVFLKALYKEKLDLVHFLNYNHPVLYRRPFVSTLQDFTVYFHPVGRSQKSKVRRLAFLLVLKHSLTGAKRVLAISENSAKDAEKVFGISHAKMEVVYEGAPDPAEIPFGSKARVQDYLGTRHPYFLFVSAWRPHKGIITLIEAFTKFKEKTGLPHQLVLIGNQKVCLDEVKAAMEKSPYFSDILAPGFVPDELLPSLYHYAAAYVCPSEYEGFGLMLLEAFGYGTPAISADNSSLPEVGGDAALYFPTGDAQALAGRLEAVVVQEGLAAELVEKGVKQLKKFSWEKCARQTLDVYLRVLEKRR